LGKDARHRGRVALIVVIDQLHRPAEEPALGVDLLLPDLHSEQGRLATGGETTGQPHAKADLDRLGGARRQQARRAEQQRSSDQDGYASSGGHGVSSSPVFPVTVSNASPSWRAEGSNPAGDQSLKRGMTPGRGGGARSARGH